MTTSDLHNWRDNPGLVRRVAKDWSWATAGSILYALAQWGILAILARLGTKTDVGAFALGLAITAPIVIASNLQLRNIQATDATGAFRFQHYLSVRLITTAGALLCVGFVVVAGRYPLQTSLTVLAVAASKAVESISDVSYGLFQQRGKLVWVGQSIAIKAPLSLAGMTAGFLVGRSALAGVLGLSVVWIILLATFDFPRVKRLLGNQPVERFAFVTEPAHLIKLIRMSAWSGLASGLVSLFPNIPRYFLASTHGIRTVGVFAALASFQVAGTTLVSATAQVTLPTLGVLATSGNPRRFGRYLSRLWAVGALIGTAGILVAVFAGRATLSLAYGREYAPYTAEFVWVMVAAGVACISSFQNFAIIAVRRLRSYFVLHVVVGAVTWSASTVLVPKFGLLGAAWAILWGALTQLLGGRVIIRSWQGSCSAHPVPAASGTNLSDRATEIRSGAAGR